MSAADIQTFVIGALQGLGASTLFLLALFIGFCVVFGLPKLRAGGRTSLVNRSIEERFGEPTVYLPPESPRGPVDQLKTPELREAAARHSA